MAAELRPIEIDRLVEGSSVVVPRLWLESDERMRRLVERVDTTRNRRRVAEAIEQFCTDPPRGAYDEISIIIHPHGRGEELTVVFEGVTRDPVGSDRLRFSLRLAPHRPGYLVASKKKLLEPVWGGGCVTEEMRRELLRLLPSNGVIWGLSERFSRAVDESEMQWDWQPRWNFEGVSTPDAERSLAELLEGKDCPCAVLATWSFAVEEQEWTASGVRVRVVFEPAAPELIAAWDEEWQMLF